MSLLFLALTNHSHAKKEKTRLDEHAIIYVLKTEEMSVENNNSKRYKCLLVCLLNCGGDNWLLPKIRYQMPRERLAVIRERGGMCLLSGLNTKLEVASVDTRTLEKRTQTQTLRLGGGTRWLDGKRAHFHFNREAEHQRGQFKTWGLKYNSNKIIII